VPASLLYWALPSLPDYPQSPEIAQKVLDSDALHCPGGTTIQHLLSDGFVHLGRAPDDHSSAKTSRSLAS
jgi:hypothetical protein